MVRASDGRALGSSFAQSDWRRFYYHGGAAGGDGGDADGDGADAGADGANGDGYFGAGSPLPTAAGFGSFLADGAGFKQVR